MGPKTFKNFCPKNETIAKQKDNIQNEEKIFANNATNKGLISKPHKQLISCVCVCVCEVALAVSNSLQRYEL